MPTFNYTAKDSSSRTVKGREVATSSRELATKLSRKNLTIISIKDVDESVAIPSSKKHVSAFDLVVFCRQLSSMVKGGIPLLRAMDAIATETKNPRLRAALKEISHRISSGDSFSASLNKIQGVFSPLFIAIVESGERVGALDTMLERLSAYLAARDRINKKIVSAITYPSVILAFFVITLAGIALFLIPRFRSMYSSFGAKLPPVTQIAFGISDFFVNNILYILGGVVVLILFLGTLIKTDKGRLTLDGIIIKIPIFGEMIMKASISKFSRTLATLLEQGITLPEALNLVSRTVGNRVIENASLRASKLILDGEKIAEAFKKVEIFPSLLIQMTSIGVESGSLPELLNKTADFYEDQVDNFVTVMSVMIEPILIIVLGIILGITIIALYSPIFGLSQAVTQAGA